MSKSTSFAINTGIIFAILTAIMLASSFGAHASSVPTATGQINSSSGAVLRRSSSADSDKISVLSDNTSVIILKEVFKSSTSTSNKNKWYYVNANGIKGYVRSDLVGNINYGSVKGKTTTAVNYRKGAGVKMKMAGRYKKGKSVTVVLKASPLKSVSGSSRTWYKIKSGSKYYYVCSSYIKLTGKVSAADNADAGLSDAGMSDREFETYLNGQGFPESYKVKLRKLHKAHPNWVFVAYKTNIKWSAALSKQTRGGTSLVHRSFPSSYRKGSKQYEPGWYKACDKVVAHYMDPRNFLNEKNIFMFEDLSYKPAYQTVSAVNAVLSPTKFKSYGFSAKLFVKAGSAANISPVFLAVRARQETGGSSDAVNGTKVLGKKVYNPFNIGAFGGKNPLYKGLLYAYAKGWFTPAKAVKGGAKQLSRNYINQGQHTLYYQRFNVRNGAAKAGTHQYMTNIMAPYSESLSVRNTYDKYGITDKSIVFEIPVYDSMPSSSKLPKK